MIQQTDLADSHRKKLPHARPIVRMQARPITAPTRCANARKPLCSLSNLCSDLSQTFEAEVQQTVTIATALDFALLTRNCYALSTIQTGLRVDAFLLTSVRVAPLPAGFLFVRDHTFYEGV